MGPAPKMKPGGPAGNQKKDKKGAPKKRDLNAPEEGDVERLPPGYKVPQEPPEPFTTGEEWIYDPSDGDPKVLKRMLSTYKQPIFQSGVFTTKADEKLVADVIRYKLSLMTRKENRDKVHDLREKLLKDVAQSPTNKNGPRDVRKFMLKTIAEEAPRLFQYHAIARINGAILLAELSDPLYNEADAEPPRKAAEPCVRAAAPLMALIKDKKQLTAPRIWGVNGLVRIAAVTDKAQLRAEIVGTLVEQLNDSVGEHEWYQWRLAEGLGKLNTLQNQDKKNVVPVALAKVLADAEKRSWLVRAEAALSLGRLNYKTENIDLGYIAYLIAELTQQMTEAYIKDTKEPKHAQWKLCFIKIYGAFKPLDDDQKRGLLTQVEGGALAANKRTVQDAFDQVLPIVRIVVKGGDGIDAHMESLKKWIEANPPPKNHKIHPDEEPIVKKQSNAGRPVASDALPGANGGR